MAVAGDKEDHFALLRFPGKAGGAELQSRPHLGPLCPRVNDLPYLQAVRSPEPGERIPNYYSRVEFTADELKARLQAAFPEADLSGGMEGWLKTAWAFRASLSKEAGISARTTPTR